MYPVVLGIHNILRWLVLILGVLAVGRAWMGWLGKKEWTTADRKVGVFFTSAIDTQLLLGLILYFFLSSIVKGALADFGAAMSNPGQRFFALEHALYMILAVVFAHLGGILPRKVQQAAQKHKRAAIWFSLALLVILLGMPWARPLIPTF